MSPQPWTCFLRSWEIKIVVATTRFRVTIITPAIISNTMLIALEGIDGSGKTTIRQMMAQRLKEMGYNVVILSEPTDGPYGRKIRQLAREFRRPSVEEELELFMKDRIEDVEKNIRPALERGDIIIIDRYYISNAAYQGARGMDPMEIIKRNEKFSPRPDITIILDIPPEIGLTRVKGRGESDGFETLDYLKKVRDIYLSLQKWDNAVVVDATRPLDEVFRHVASLVEERMEDA